MKFLPTENITYKTSLKEEEIINRLSSIIEPKRNFRFGIFSSGSSRGYEGRINGLTFDITRIIGYRNSFLPRINGIIVREVDGMTINVKMRLHVFVIVFLGLWCSGVGLALIAFLTKAIISSEINFATFIPFGMLLFAYLLTMGGFKYESNKSKKDLQELFEATSMDA